MNVDLLKIVENLFKRRNDYIVINNELETAFVPGGHNGPHYDIESPVRNTSHFVVFLVCAQKISDDFRDDRLIRMLANWYILNNEFFLQEVFVHRTPSENKDCVNGVIGPAWVLEALYYLHEYTQNPSFRELASKIAGGHKFSNKGGLWFRNDPVSNKYNTDKTLDHQVWFAYSLALNQFKQKEVTLFLDSLNGPLFRTHSTGLIKHIAFENSPKGWAVFYMNEAKRGFHSHLDNLEHGYHIYTLAGLTLLRKYYGNHPFYRSDKFNRALTYIDNINFEDLRSNKFFYNYNHPLGSLLLINRIFGDCFNASKAIEDVVKVSADIGMLKENEFVNLSDWIGSKSRLYELVNTNDICVEFLVL